MFGRVLAVVGGFYAVGGLLVAFQRVRAPLSGATTWWKFGTYGAFVVAMLVVAALGEVPYALVIVAVLVCVLWEYARAARLPRVARSALMACGSLVAAASLVGGTATLYPLVLVLSLAMLAAGAFAIDPQRGVTVAVWSVTGLLAVGMPAVHLLLVPRHSAWFTSFAFLLLVVASSDAFAEVVGKRWIAGRGVLRASPNKSVSGFIGGLGGALLMALALHAVVGLWTLPVALGLGFLLSVAATVGDLMASGLKRALGVKDFGTVLGDHGGVLDRFDSLIFAALPYYWMIGAA